MTDSTRDMAGRTTKAMYIGLPYLLLVLSTVVAVFDSAGRPPDYLGWVLGLAVLTAVWLAWPVVTLPSWPANRTTIVVFFAGLLALVGALITRNAAFVLLGALGYNFALVLMPPRLIVWAVAATAAVTTATQGGATLGPYALVANIAVPLLFVGWYVARQSEKRNEMITELEAANRRLAVALDENVGLHAQLVTQAREAGVLDERDRMAREIHDTIAQGLAGIITQLQVAENATDRPDVLRRHLGNAERLARESLTEARRSVRALRPELLETSQLPDALGQIVAKWADLNHVVADMETTGTVTPLHPEIDMTLLRVAQEALANVGRHSNATRVRVTLSYFGDVVTLDVRDNGVGFDPATARTSDRQDSGFGLAGMRQRLARVAGTLEIESEPGGGCALSASLPAIPVEQPSYVSGEQGD